MQTIRATPPLQIDADEFSWRLINIQYPQTPLVEATSDGLQYVSAMSRARRLPEGGLPVNDVEMVIVGWEAGVWQLGLLLAAEVAQVRGGRWCGLARWADESGTTEQYAARTAGQLLSGVLGKPYQFVAPELNHEDDQLAFAPAPIDPAQTMITETPSEPIIPTPRPILAQPTQRTFPLTSGEWSLNEMRLGLRWEHSKAWRRDMLIRTVFFSALTAIFVFLSVGGIVSPYAPVQPEWLPIVGIGVTILMGLNTLYNLGALWMTNSVEFDTRSRMIRVIRRPSGVVRQIPFEKVEYILLSQAILRRDPFKNDPSTEKISAEVWLHIRRPKGDFLQIGHVSQADGQALRSLLPTPAGRGTLTGVGRYPLHVDQIDTPTHHAAAWIGRVMEVPVYVEDRAI